MGGSERFGFGAWWFLCVGRPIYPALLCCWFWRGALMCLLFGRFAKLNLAIVPSHPDRAGGLGFLERFPKAFMLVVLAMSVVIASRWAHDVVYHGVGIQSLRLPMLAKFVIMLIGILLLPRLMERIRLPGVRGYILAGVVIGPPLLGVVKSGSETINFFAEIGND